MYWTSKELTNQPFRPSNYDLMTKKTRYFVTTAGAVLVVGLGGGLIAYLAYNRLAGIPAGVPSEVRYVPVDAEVIAFANVRAIMDSELRRALAPSIDPESRKGKQMMSEFAGVDLEKQVDHVVMYVEPLMRQNQDDATGAEIPRASLLVNGSFDQARIEQFIRDHGGAVQEHNGRKLFVREGSGREQVAVGFVEQDLIAIGQADLIRRAIDISRGSARDFRNVTNNSELMNLVRDNSGSTAWVAGQFDEISRRMRLPASISGQVPPVRLVSVKADINGGVKATIRAEAGDKAAADQLRDAVRGFISLARLHGGGKEEFANVLKTVELSGSDNTVRVSFAVSPETLRVIAPSPRRGGRGPAPSAPQPPAPPARPK
jgi:hypothetical protein